MRGEREPRERPRGVRHMRRERERERERVRERERERERKQRIRREGLPTHLHTVQMT